MEWKKVFVGSEPRLSEVVENYKALGYKVRVENAKPEEMEGCNICFNKELCEKGIYKVVYIKEGGERSKELDELFE